MVSSVLAFVCGILVLQQCAELPNTYWLAGLFFLFVTCLFLKCWRLMFFTIGMLWASYYASLQLNNILPDRLQGRTLHVEGKIIGLPQYDDRRIRFNFAVTKSEYPLPAKIRLSWYNNEQVIKSGQLWRMTLKLKKPHGRLNPGGFDYQRWLFMHNIGATGYVKNPAEASLLQDARPWQSIDSMRQLVNDEISRLLDDDEMAGLIKALTIGVKNEITESQWQLFRNTGTIHLLAISGLHIGLISALSYFLMQKLAVQLLLDSPQKWAAIITLLLALFYSALAGFSLPTQRSLIMLTVAMLAMALQRNTSLFSILALAMFAVLIIDPLAVLSAGFWLSFLAVSLIVYCMAGRLGQPNRFLAMTKIHWLTAIGLSPLLMFYFQQLSIIAPLANFVAVPVISILIVPLCFLAVMLLFISTDLASVVLLLIEQILKYLCQILVFMADLPYASITTNAIPYYLLPFALLGILILFAPRGIPGKWLAGVMILPVIFLKQDRPELGESRINLLDVGQGLAMLVETTNHTLLYDTGAKYSQHSNMGRAVVMPFLRYRGIEKIDTLLISHGDNDHIGGAYSILQQYPVDRVISSVPEQLSAYRSTRCVAGQSWQWDQVVFEILSPPASLFQQENNNSCVLKITTSHNSLLLTGDIEQHAENWLLENAAVKLPAQILLAPHHGSKTSSTEAFIQLVRPDMVLIPAGYRNRFNFPHQPVLDRYAKHNISWFNTADSGAIILETGAQISITTMRKPQRHYWHRR